MGTGGRKPKRTSRRGIPPVATPPTLVKTYRRPPKSFRFPKGFIPPIDAEPGTILQYFYGVPVRGYTIKRGPRKGKRVKGYTKHFVAYLIAPRAPIKPPEFQVTPTQWVELDEYAEETAADEGVESDIEYEVPVYLHRDGDALIEVNTLMMYDHPLKELTLKSLRASEVGLLRVWFLLANIKNEDDPKLFVLCGTRSLMLYPEYTRRSLKSAYTNHVKEGFTDPGTHKFVRSMEEEMSDWVAEKKSYLEYRRLFCWTAYVVPRGKDEQEKLPWTRRKGPPGRKPRRRR